jgi:hypothetical protein
VGCKVKVEKTLRVKHKLQQMAGEEEEKQVPKMNPEQTQ